MREWAIQNAEQWVRDYHVDGLRLDAVGAIVDDTPQHICAELAERVHAVSPRALVISEIEVGDWRPIEEWGHDAQWRDASHHELHALLTGEQDGYYAGYGSVRALAGDLQGRATIRAGSSCCAQNHDQVGNRAAGDRLPPDALRVAAALTLFSPCTPLLFMGEEHFEEHPFQFFTDHIDPAIAAATREGRKEEFAAFTSFSRRGRSGPAGRRDVPALEDRRARAGSALPRAARAAQHAAAQLEVVEADEEAKRSARATRRRRARRRLPRASTVEVRR